MLKQFKPLLREPAYMLDADPMDEEMNAAWIAANGGKCPPIQEHITIACETHPGYTLSDGTPYPFVHRDEIPERFHATIKALSLGSTCPAPDGRRGLFYTYDIDRWLRAIGVQVTFINKTPNTAP